MEHTHDLSSPAVLARFARRCWKTQIRVTCAAIAAAAVMGYAAHRYLDDYEEAAEARLQTKRAATVQSPGVVYSLRSAGLGSPYDGLVRSVSVRKGQAVRRGQLLFRMDVTGLQSQLQSARGHLRAAEASLAELYAQRRADVRELEAAISELEAVRVPEAPRLFADGEAHAFPGYDPPVDDAYDQNREEQIEIVKEQLRQKLHAWEPALREAGRARRAALADVARIRTWLARADRRAPIDGVVTEMRAEPGRWVGAQQPVVRVDDPRAYRVVTLVRADAREGLKPGAALTLNYADGQERARLVKIVDGWDRDVFRYWLWLKPQDPQTLTPGQPVAVTVSQHRLLASSR